MALSISEKKAPKAKARGKVRVPTKRTINLATVGEKKQSWLLAIPGVLLIILLAGVFSKFLVIDRLQALADAQNEVAQVRMRIDECNRQIDAYGELNDIYAHYTYSGFTQEELSIVDRVEVMDLLERVVLPRTIVDAWNLTGNILTLNIDGSTLEEINITTQELMAEDMVSFVTVNTARTNRPTTTNTDVQEEEQVVANIVVYLNKVEEVDRA